jgi:hypothetical protein
MTTAEPAYVKAYVCDGCGDLFLDPEEGGVYECSRCSGVQVDNNRCEQCNIFMSKIGDECCPQCQCVDLSEKDAFQSPDGKLWETREEWEQWVADTPKREARKKEHTSWMLAEQERRDREREVVKHRFGAVLPIIRELLPDYAERYYFTVETTDQEMWAWASTAPLSSTQTIETEEFLGLLEHIRDHLMVDQLQAKRVD